MQITGVSNATFRALRERLLENHQAEVTGDTEGALSGHGVTADYRYDSGGEVLTVNIKHHPFFIPVAAIEAQLRDAVAGCQGGK